MSARRFHRPASLRAWSCGMFSKDKQRTLALGNRMLLQCAAPVNGHAAETYKRLRQRQGQLHALSACDPRPISSVSPESAKSGLKHAVPGVWIFQPRIEVTPDTTRTPGPSQPATAPPYAIAERAVCAIVKVLMGSVRVPAGARPAATHSPESREHTDKTRRERFRMADDRVDVRVSNGRQKVKHEWHQMWY